MLGILEMLKHFNLAAARTALGFVGDMLEHFNFAAVIGLLDIVKLMLEHFNLAAVHRGSLALWLCRTNWNIPNLALWEKSVGILGEMLEHSKFGVAVGNSRRNIGTFQIWCGSWEF